MAVTVNEDKHSTVDASEDPNGAELSMAYQLVCNQLEAHKTLVEKNPKP